MLHKIADNRFHAFLIHLLLSALIAITIILAAILVWYPSDLINVTGAKKIFLMVIGIDVCIGPILTLVVFNKKKKELSRDLAIIFAIQICALVYGMYTVTVARPVYIVFAVDRFELVQANDINKKSLKKVSIDKFKTLPLFKPQWVTALLPDDDEERNDILFNAIDTDADLAQLPQYYHDYSKSVDEIIKRAKPLNELKALNADQTDLVESLIKKYPDQDRYGFLPMSARKMDLSVIIDRHNGKPIETNLLQPW